MVYKLSHGFQLELLTFAFTTETLALLFSVEIRSFYYIYTNEIPSELSCEHNIFTCEKIIVVMVTHKNPKSEMI